jgi:uncharacterized protein (TIGR00725 family)
MSAPLYVAVSGSGDATGSLLEMAEEVGRLVARAGAVVVCGGLGGVMQAAARGAAAEGGVSIGILPGGDRTEQGPDLTYSFPTAMGEGRNVLIARAADALIAIGGGYGTLSEIAFALKIDVPVVGLDTWELHREGRIVEAFPVAKDAEEAVRIALESARTRANPG